jgi:tetratricopeptide (TPR) repeat protein
MKPELNKLIILIPFLLFNIISFSQKDIAFKESNFEDKKAFHDAYDELLDGNDYYTDKSYIIALSHYKISQEFNPNNAKLNYRMGVCYLHTNQKFESLKYLKSANNINSTKFSNIDFRFGQAYQYLLKFDDAINHYHKYLDEKKPTGSKKEIVEKKIQECKNGKYLIMHPVSGMVINLKDINTEYPEYSPMLSADQQNMIFTSRREGTTGDKKDIFDLMYYEDIYQTEKIGNQWQIATQVEGGLNTKKHDANVGLSNDGQTIFIYRSDKNNGDIYKSTLIGYIWGNPEPLPEPINSKC